ncbi:MAG TPA: M13 family peptidase, partial [Ignavibacteria bacterium]|nr:M13 family peptidase [Ignavibacteria bacterium]
MKFLSYFIIALYISVPAFAQHETGSLQDKVQGIDLTNMDLSIAPMADFYEYVNGGWIKSNPIPAGYSRWSSFSEVEA